MSEERELEDLDEEYEDLDDLETFTLDLQEYSDMAGLEEIPEEQIVESSDKDIIITGCLQNRGTLFYLNFFLINGEFHCSSLDLIIIASPAIASKRHIS